MASSISVVPLQRIRPKTDVGLPGRTKEEWRALGAVGIVLI
jgi:hypothetical protein